MSVPGAGKLVFFCGKMAAGKTTLSREISVREDAVLLVQDDLLGDLYPDEIVDVAGYARRWKNLTKAISPHIRELLARGLTVVLDFPANSRQQRAWFRGLLEGVDASHELHYIVASDALCKRQLRARCAGLPEGAAWTSEAEFDAITAYFDPPSPDEGFHVIRHQRG